MSIHRFSDVIIRIYKAFNIWLRWNTLYRFRFYEDICDNVYIVIITFAAVKFGLVFSSAFHKLSDLYFKKILTASIK